MGGASLKVIFDVVTAYPFEHNFKVRKRDKEKPSELVTTAEGVSQSLRCAGRILFSSSTFSAFSTIIPISATLVSIYPPLTRLILNPFRQVLCW